MNQPLKYVVLRHEGVDEPHFDLMFETKNGSDLATWRASEWPVDAQTEFTPLRAHRRAYLQFEGQISGDRGMVHRVHQGEHVVEEDRPDIFIVKLEDGTRLLLPRAVK